jgi:hypothetical protein
LLVVGLAGCLDVTTTGDPGAIPTVPGVSAKCSAASTTERWDDFRVCVSPRANPAVLVAEACAEYAGEVNCVTSCAVDRFALCLSDGAIAFPPD